MVKTSSIRQNFDGVKKVQRGWTAAGGLALMTPYYDSPEAKVKLSSPSQ